MATTSCLIQLLDESARRFPDRVAVSVPEGPSLTYRDLSDVSDRLRDRLVRLGVGHGDRVGFRLHKSLDSVVVLFAVMKAGATYVPVDAESPAARGAFILNDCQVKVVVTERELAPDLIEAMSGLGASPQANGWSDDTPVPPEVFGPLWPEGRVPKWAKKGK